MWQVGRPTMIIYIYAHLARVAYHLHILACLCSAALVLSAEHNVSYASQCVYKYIHPGVCVCVYISPWVTYVCMYIYRHAYIYMCGSACSFGRRRWPHIGLFRVLTDAVAINLRRVAL